MSFFKIFFLWILLQLKNKWNHCKSYKCYKLNLPIPFFGLNSYSSIYVSDITGNIYVLKKVKSKNKVSKSKKALLTKICSTYPIMMKLDTIVPYLKKIQKLSESRDTPWVLLTWAFFNENHQILLYQEIQI